MRRLFVKIFIWFWVAMTLVSVVSLVVALATESHPLFRMPWIRLFMRGPGQGQMRADSGYLPRPWMAAVRNSITLSGRTGIEIYEREGQMALFDYFNRLQDASRIPLYLLNDRQERLAGGPLPDEVLEMASAPEYDGFGFKRSGDYIFIAEELSGHGGRKYTLAARLPARQFAARDNTFVWINFIILVLTAGGVCYWLARYISAPISRLGAAARNFADGNLKVRVGQVLGGRRDEIGDLGRDFDMMAERIESLVTSRNRLLRDISHEFRSPLTRLALALEIARRPDEAERLKALDRIGVEAQRLDSLIGQLLVLARLESAEKMEAEPVDMERLVEEVAADADFEAGESSRSVRVISAERCHVQGTRDLLRSALENVVRNAIRYAPENTEVQIVLRQARKEDGLFARIEVRDFGPGAPEDQLKDLFSPFYRVGDSRDRKDGGTGLGLAITERAARLHGGSTWAKNAPGGGLLVTIELPATPPSTQKNLLLTPPLRPR